MALNHFPIVLIASGLTTFLLTGCYQAKSASGTIDLSDIPGKVALVQTVESPVANFGVQARGTEADVTFTLKNTGPYPASNLGSDSDSPALAAPFSFKDGTYPGTGGTCASSLEPEAECTIVLAYKPTALGPFLAQLNLSYFDGILVAPFAVLLQGTTPAELVFTDSSLFDFGTEAVGTQSVRLITVRNDGITPALFKSAEFLPPSGDPGATVPFDFSGGAFPGATGSCSLVMQLAPGASCTLSLAFDSAQAGFFNGDSFALTYANGVAGPSGTPALAHSLSGSAN